MLATNLERRSALMSGPSRDTVDSQAESNTDANEENRILRRNNVGRRSKWLYPMLLALLALFLGVIGTPVVVLVLNSESRLSIHRANNSTVTTEGLTIAAVTRHPTSRPRRTAPTGPSVNIVDLTIPSRPRGTRGSSTAATRRTHRPDTKRERMYGPEVHEKSVEPSVQLLTDHPVPVPKKKKGASNLNQHDHYQKRRHRYDAEGAANFTSSPTRAKFQTTRKNVSVAQPAFQVGLNNHSHKHFPRRKVKGLNKLSSPAHSLKGRHPWSGHKKKRTTKVTTVAQSGEPTGENDTQDTSRVATDSRGALETANTTAAGTSQAGTFNQTNVTTDSTFSQSLTAGVTQSRASDTSEITEERMVPEEQTTSVAEQNGTQTLAGSAPKSEEGGISTVSEGDNGTTALKDVSPKFSADSEMKYGNNTSGGPLRGPADARISTESFSYVRSLSNITRRTDALDAFNATTKIVKGDTLSRTTITAKAANVTDVSEGQEISVGKPTWTLASSASKLQEEPKSTSVSREAEDGTTVPKTVSSKISADSKMKLANDTKEAGPGGHTEEGNSTESLLTDKFSHVRELSNYTSDGLDASNATTESTQSDGPTSPHRESPQESTVGPQDVVQTNGSALPERSNPVSAPNPRAETADWNQTSKTARATRNSASSEATTTAMPVQVQNYSETEGPLLGNTSDKEQSVSTAGEIQRSPSSVTVRATSHFNTTNAARVPNPDVEGMSANATGGLNGGNANETDTTGTGVGLSGRTQSNRQPGQRSNHEDPLSDNIHNMASKAGEVGTRAHSNQPVVHDVFGSTERPGSSTKREVTSRATAGRQERSSHSPLSASTLADEHFTSASSEAIAELRSADTSTARAPTMKISTLHSTTRNRNSAVQNRDHTENEVPRERERKFSELSTTRPTRHVSRINASTMARGAGTTVPSTSGTEDEDDDDDEESNSTVSSKSSSETPTTAPAVKTVKSTPAVLIKRGSSTKAAAVRVVPEFKLELKVPSKKALPRGTTLFLRNNTRESLSGIGSRIQPKVPQRQPPPRSSLPSPRPPTQTPALTKKTTVEGVRNSTDNARRHINTTSTSLLWIPSTTSGTSISNPTQPGSSRHRKAPPPVTEVSSRGRILQVDTGTARPAVPLAGSSAETTKIPPSAATMTEDSDLVWVANKDSSPRSPESHVRSVGQSVDYYEDNTTFINESPQDKTDEPETIHKRRVHEELDDVTEMREGTSTTNILQTAYYDDDVSSEARRAAKPTADDESPQYENSPEESFDDLFYR